MGNVIPTLKGISVLIPVVEASFHATVDFYTKIIGITQFEIGESELSHPWCRMTLSGCTITIHAAREGKFPYPEFKPTGHGIALDIHADNLESVLLRLESYGVEPINVYVSGGTKALSVMDPAGNVLEVWQDVV